MKNPEIIFIASGMCRRRDIQFFSIFGSLFAILQRKIDNSDTKILRFLRNFVVHLSKILMKKRYCLKVWSRREVEFEKIDFEYFVRFYITSHFYCNFKIKIFYTILILKIYTLIIYTLDTNCQIFAQSRVVTFEVVGPAIHAVFTGR